MHLAACHRVLRGQPFDAPGAYQHFRLFALVSSARDQGSAKERCLISCAATERLAATLAAPERNAGTSGYSRLSRASRED